MAESAPTRSPDRYRRAAEDTLQQLNWCMGYLHARGNTTVARALARNCGEIRRRMMR